MNGDYDYSLGASRTLSGEPSKIRAAAPSYDLGDSRTLSGEPSKIRVAIPNYGGEETSNKRENKPVLRVNDKPVPLRTPDFHPVKLKRSGSNLLVTLNPGFLHECITKGETDGWVEHEPLVDGDPITTSPAPELAMTIGDTAYLKVQTNNRGEVKTGTDTSPRILAGSTVPDTVHYQPPSLPDEPDGTDGEYYVKLFSYTLSGSALVFTPFHLGSVDFYHDLWTGENVGNGHYIYLRRHATNDTFQFRSLLDNYGLIFNQESEEIKCDAWVESVGDGCPVLVEPEDPENLEEGPVELRSIKSRASQPQVNVRCEPANPGDPLPGVITVEGNGVSGSLVVVGCDESETTILQWDDGLITTSATEPIKIYVGECAGSSTEPPPP